MEQGFGIALPHNIEAEMSVIGAVLLDSESFEIAAEKVTADDFFKEPHQKIFKAMQDVFDSGEPVVLVTVTSKLMERKELEDVGGVSYLSDLTNSVPTAANIGIYASKVKDCSTNRMIINESRKLMLEASQGGDPSKVIARLQRTTDMLSDKAIKKQDFKPISEVAMETFDRIERASQTISLTGGVTGIPSGYTDLDKMTSGFQRSDLIIVAARPSVGKTALALNVAQNVGIRARETVAIFSLEMGAVQLVQRMVGTEANIEADRLRSGNLVGDQWERLTMALGVITSANIHIDDSPVITVSDIRAKCRRLKKEKGLGMILIDYLQLIAGNGKGMNRQQEVSEISRTLKQIARELDVPVIALSQLSRGVEQRQVKRPMMSDLRESGSIEQDADIVAFLYRDDYYEKDSERKNIIEVIIAKQRNGAVGTIELAFQKQYGKFLDLERSQQQSMPF